MAKTKVYLALVGFSVAGVPFEANTVVPDDAFDKETFTQLVKMGRLAHVEEGDIPDDQGDEDEAPAAPRGKPADRSVGLPSSGSTAPAAAKLPGA